MLGGFAGRLNVYRVMAHNPALLRSWAAFRDHVVVRNALGPQRSEVAILRTGHRLGASYEWAHHVCRGRACGLDDARILGIRGEPEAMAPEDAVIVRAVDDLIDHARLSPPVREALAALVGTAGVFDVIATVGLYSTLAFIVGSFDTPLDEDVAAQLADRPIG
ncbi:carboxymuconolactone decarboxylase [Azospirillum sp. TSO35-2]|nr:carboxymuconolactone decarboxylase [Azospirillum sp. TSO35-2]